MKRDRSGGDREASLSFLDVIACAFGAIVLLVLVLPVGELGDSEPGAGLADYGALLLQLAELRETASLLEERLAADQQRANALEDLLSERKDVSDALRDLVARTRSDADVVRRRIAATEQARSAISAIPEQEPNEPLPADYAGIPVDSEYIAIVVDTSGSMRTVWPRVVREVENVLSIYPRVQGFQVLSASGDYLWKRGAWITDSGGNRRLAKVRLHTWSAYSASNPEQGILTAIRDLYRSDMKMAVFVFGDDYMGTDYDNFLASVRTGVDRHASPQGQLRIHAFGFPSSEPSVQRAKYATLAREMASRHDGVFLALSN